MLPSDLEAPMAAPTRTGDFIKGGPTADDSVEVDFELLPQQPKIPASDRMNTNASMKVAYEVLINYP